MDLLTISAGLYNLGWTALAGYQSHILQVGGIWVTATCLLLLLLYEGDLVGLTSVTYIVCGCREMLCWWVLVAQANKAWQSWLPSWQAVKCLRLPSHEDMMK